MPRSPRRRRRKRCPFCQTLLHPHPRLGARQWACNAPVCQRERHAQNCRTWRRRNRALTRTHHQDSVQPARAGTRPPPVSSSDLDHFGESPPRGARRDYGAGAIPTLG